MIRSIKFLGIPVRDQDRALAFYTKTLGFSVVTDQEMGGTQRWIEVKPPRGDTMVALFTPEGQEDRIGSFLNASFTCDDVQKTYDDLRAKGVEFEKPPQRQPWGSFAILKDSEGNRLVIGS
jgi:predicted enzyme related to lactoylglutathione lyase